MLAPRYACPRAVGPVEPPGPCVRSEAWRAETAAGKKRNSCAPDFPENHRRGHSLDSKGRSLWLILCLLSVQRQKVGRRRPLPNQMRNPTSVTAPSLIRHLLRKCHLPPGEGQRPRCRVTAGPSCMLFQRMRMAAWKASWLASARTRPVDTQSPTT